MTLPMVGLAPPQSLRLRWPVWGFDISTKRVSAGVLTGAAGRVIEDEPPFVAWDTLTLKQPVNLAQRLALAHDQIVGFLQLLETRHSRPGAIGLEVPLAGATTPLVSFWTVGAFYSAVGHVWPDMLTFELNPPEWKKLATGHGYAPGLPQMASRGEKRKAEKARLMAWARDVCGWAGSTVEDEADALGVAVATGVKVTRHR